MHAWSLYAMTKTYLLSGFLAAGEFLTSRSDNPQVCFSFQLQPDLHPDSKELSGSTCLGMDQGGSCVPSSSTCVMEKSINCCMVNEQIEGTSHRQIKSDVQGQDLWLLALLGSEIQRELQEQYKSFQTYLCPVTTGRKPANSSPSPKVTSCSTQHPSA